MEPLYRIKPLEWRWEDDISAFASECALGRIELTLDYRGRWSIRRYPTDGHCVLIDKVDHKEGDELATNAKAAAEQWYLSKLREALIEASPASPKEEDR